MIDDPDGYANIRNGGGNSFIIIDRIYDDEIFYYDGNSDEEWYKIYYRKNGNYVTGFLHKSRIMEISLLQKIGTTKETYQSVSISNDTLKFEIRIKKFERDKHHYEFGDSSLLLKIDGNKPCGVDGSYPEFEIDQISLMVKGKTVTIPPEAYSDTIEFDFTSLNIFQNSNGTMLIVSSHSDGAGYYDLDIQKSRI